MGETCPNLLESGQRQSPSAETAAAFASVLGTTIDWLVTGKGERPTKDGVAAAVKRARSRQAA